MDLFVDGFGSGINRFAADIAPFQRGLLPLLELVFVTENHPRQLRESQGKICPGAPDVQVQIAAKIEGGDRERPIVAAGVIVIPTPMIEPSANKSHAAFFES